jgi:hypothetical protein
MTIPVAFDTNLEDVTLENDSKAAPTTTLANDVQQAYVVARKARVMVVLVGQRPELFMCNVDGKVRQTLTEDFKRLIVNAFRKAILRILLPVIVLIDMPWLVMLGWLIGSGNFLNEGPLQTVWNVWTVVGCMIDYFAVKTFYRNLDGGLKQVALDMNEDLERLGVFYEVDFSRERGSFCTPGRSVMHITWLQDEARRSSMDINAIV